MIKLAPNLELPSELSGRRTAIFGISGSGKSNTATVITEGLLAAGEQVVLIDPKGESWGLLSTASGKPSNLDLIIFGEPNGHIEALNESHGPKLADFVFESGRSVALSLLGFESDQSERRFVSTFLRHLYRRKSKHAKKSRTLVVFDEAHLFVPEQARGDQTELAGAVQRIARQGRTFGLGSLFVDQRPQDVSKRVVTQVDTIICHQLVHNTDRAALSEWVKGYDVDGRGKTFLDSLASLEPGEAWVWSPAWLKIFQRVKVARRKTFDSGAAPDETTATKVQRAEIDLDTLRGQLTEIVEKAKADDPKELRKRIAELERQLKAKPAAAVDQAAIDRQVAAAVAQRDREWQANNRIRERLLDDFRGRMAKAGNKLSEVTHLLHVNGEAKVGIPPAPSIDPAETGHRSARTLSDRRGSASSTADPAMSGDVHRRQNQGGHGGRKPEESSALTDLQLNKTQQRIIDAIAWYESLGNAEPTVTQIGAVALIDATGGYFSNTVGPLSSAGLVDRASGRLRLTDAGRALARPIDAPDSLDAYHDVLRQRVRKMKSASGQTIRVLDVIIAASGNELTAEEIGHAVGIDHTGGYFSNTIGPLGTAGLIERQRGKVIPTEVLFPKGLN